MSTVITYPFTTPSNYSYDASLIEISGGVAKLVSRQPTDSTSWATYTTDLNLNYGGGTLTGTANGGAAIVASQLDCTGGTSKYVDYDAILNADSQQTGCIRFKIQPDYSGVPVAIRGIMDISKGHNLSENRIGMYHNGTNLYCFIYDSTATIKVNINGAWSPVAGQLYEIEINYNLTAGETRVFVDGVLLMSDLVTTATRDANINLIRVGSNNGANWNPDFYFEDFIVFGAVQHTANYTAGYTLKESKYDKTNPPVTTNTSFVSTEIVNWATTETEPGSDAVKFTLVASSQDRWVTGGNAADSNGTYAESSTSAEMDSDHHDLINARETVVMKIFLHSDSGLTTPEIDLISLEYDAALQDPIIGTILSNIEGFLYDTNGPIANETVEVRPFEKGFWNGDVFHMYGWETVATTDAEGFFSGSIYVQPTGEFWEMRFGSKRYKFSIPSQSEVNLKNATTWEVIEA